MELLTILASIASSAITAYLTVRLTVESRYGEAARRLFVVIMRYYLVYEALISPENIEPTDGGSRFRNKRDEDVYLSSLQGIRSSLSSILESPSASELLEKKLQIASLPIAIDIELYNFSQTKLISNKSCLKVMFDVMHFLLTQEPIKKLAGQKEYREVIAIHRKINDHYLTNLLGFNPNADM